jgi:hypothetical protein
VLDSIRASRAARLAGVAARALALMGVAGVLAAPVLAGSSTSPGCAAWDAIGPAGLQTELMTIPGPFDKGDKLKFTIENQGEIFYLALDVDPGAPVNYEFLFTTTTTGKKAFVVPKDIPEITITGQDHPPTSWILTDFACVPAALAGGSGPDTAASAAPPPSDLNSARLWLVLVAIAAGAMWLAGRRANTAVS